MTQEYVLHPFRPETDLRIDYQRELNDQQRAAVMAPPGPALVIAGAGAGKTRTLIYRAAFLLEQGITPDRLLLLTFTNKAAREMMRRVADLLGGGLGSIWGGTFHAIANRVLRQHAEQLGYSRHFTILDREDQKDAIHASVTDAKVDVKASRFPKPEVLADIFSLSANTERPIGQVIREDFPYFIPVEEQVGHVQCHYHQRKRSADVVDFDDLLVLWLRLLQDHEEVRAHYQRRFQFILVDEYQDTNRIQGDLVDLLAARHHNVMAVGDDAQSIYSWRGANFRNILEFPNRHPGCTLYRIENNYRSTPEILNLANQVIAHNTQQFPKTLLSTRRAGIRPVRVHCHSADEQAAFVAQRALQLRDEGVALRDMAVLYRAHFHALELQLELTRRNIPFSITSGIRLLEQAHIKDVIAHLKLVSNPRDEMAFKRAVRLLPGIGGVSADRLWKQYRGALPSETQGAVSPIAATLQGCRSSVPSKAAVPWTQLATTVSQLESSLLQGPIDRLIRIVLEAGYEDYMQAHFSNYRSRMDDLNQLISFTQQFRTLEEFLSQMALLTELEAEAQRTDGDDELIRLSTVHQAKGLEFAVVFVIMLTDGQFPSQRSIEDLEALEEERRLFYVAVTRARDELYLCHPASRLARGSGLMEMLTPSRFLGDLPESLHEVWNLTHPESWD